MKKDREISLHQAQLRKIVLGYWHSQALFVSNSLDIYSRISEEGPMDIEELARRCEVPAYLFERLLNACVSIGLLEKKDGKFGNSPLSENLLVRGKPDYIGSWVRFMADWYDSWGKLREAVSTGRAVESPEALLGRKEDYTRNFVFAMHEYAAGPGKELADALDLDGVYRLLDVGGGPGTYSMLLAENNPELKCTVFDLPSIVEITEEIIAESEAWDRVSTRAGNFYEDDFGSGIDAVLLSNVLHQGDPETCKMVIGKAYDCLVKEGLVIVHGSFLSPEKGGPMWPAFQSVFLPLIYGGGRIYTIEETLDMLSEVGFVKPKVRHMSLLNANSFIVAEKS